MAGEITDTTEVPKYRMMNGEELTVEQLQPAAELTWNSYLERRPLLRSALEKTRQMDRDAAEILELHSKKAVFEEMSRKGDLDAHNIGVAALTKIDSRIETIETVQSNVTQEGTSKA